MPLGIIQKDETKTVDMMDILDEYHKYVPSDVEGRPIKLPLFCDGLSCERVHSAQLCRSNCNDQWRSPTRFRGVCTGLVQRAAFVTRYL